MTKEMFEEITKWQGETFRQATALSAANHLKEEVDELIYDLTSEGDMRKAESEYADCFLLLFGSAKRYGLSYENICEIIDIKMGINKLRTWGNVNKKGYVKHLSNSEQNPDTVRRNEADSSNAAGDKTI